MENKNNLIPQEDEFLFGIGFGFEEDMGDLFDYNGSPFVIPGDENSPVTSIHVCPNCDGAMWIDARTDEDGNTEFVSHRCRECGYEY